MGALDGASRGDPHRRPGNGGPVRSLRPSTRPRLGPAEARARWDLGPLWDQGHDGQGVTIAQIQFGATVDQQALDTFTDCLGLRRVTVHQMPADAPYAPSGESMSDAEITSAIANGIEDLYVFVGDADENLDALTLDRRDIRAGSPTSPIPPGR